MGYMIRCAWGESDRRPVYFTRLDAFINSLAIGAAAGVIGHLAFGPATGIIKGIVAFLISFAVFEWFRRRRPS